MAKKMLSLDEVIALVKNQEWEKIISHEADFRSMGRGQQVVLARQKLKEKTDEEEFGYLLGFFWDAQHDMTRGVPEAFNRMKKIYEELCLKWPKGLEKTAQSAMQEAIEWQMKSAGQSQVTSS
jgi:hypothetical protein